MSTTRTLLSIGTGPGIGLATAERFAAAGFHTVLASRTPQRVAAYAERLRANGARSEAVAIDASSAESVKAVINDVLNRNGQIDVLHYNAASLRQASLFDQAPDSFLSDLSINVAGAMVAIRTVSASMFARQQGTILLTGGRFGLNPSPDYISLSVGKAGLRALALGLFDIFRDNGVHLTLGNVSGPVDPQSSLPRRIAECFWEAYSQSRDNWRPELNFAS